MKYFHRKDKDAEAKSKDKSKDAKENVWTTLNPAMAHQLSFDRDCGTPMILGQRQSDSESDDHDQEKEEALYARRLFDEIQMSSWRAVEKIFRTEDGRKRFMNWLFKLADTTHSGKITVQELGCLLDAIGNDGIRPDEFSCSNQKNTPMETIMAQFDTDSMGLISSYL